MERAVQVTAAATPAAVAEETMALYDACWFHRLVLLSSPSPTLPAQSSPPESAVDVNQPQPERAISAFSSSPTAAGLRHRRTRSDEATAFQQGLEPLQIPTNRARLETILSGKDGIVAQPQPHPLPERTRRPAVRARRRPGQRRRRRGRSMSELEFEEVKGLQDLGFTFSDAEVDAELASIVPGLLRRKRSGEVGDEHLLASTASAPATAAPEELAAAAGAVSDSPDSAAPPRRPYLSEAWDDEDTEEQQVRAMLRNWRIPQAVDGADLKENLRMWAHTVASAVR